jgi:exopolyphosphatase / guanosine-5'-triphosphate,3'-diphosphate pyrophosphatase
MVRDNPFDGSSNSMPTFAAIDIGSNSVRLKISRLQAGRLKEIHEDREVTRLGEGVFSGGCFRRRR